MFLFIGMAIGWQSSSRFRQQKPKERLMCTRLCFLIGDFLSENALEVVPHVDLQRYLGKWYEIARLPARFQEGCTETTATYALAKNGGVSVLNECMRHGKLSRAVGKAKVADKATGAKLKVSFFWPFYADYWIIKLGGDYSYAVVGAPSRKYLWILSRTPQMDEGLFSELLEFAKSKGFDVGRLIRTSQTSKTTG